MRGSPRQRRQALRSRTAMHVSPLFGCCDGSWFGPLTGDQIRRVADRIVEGEVEGKQKPAAVIAPSGAAGAQRLGVAQREGKVAPRREMHADARIAGPTGGT